MTRLTWEDSLVGRLCFEAYRVDCEFESKEPSKEAFEGYWQELKASGSAGHMTAPTIEDRAVLAFASGVPFVIRMTWRIVIPVIRQACDLISKGKLNRKNLVALISKEVNKYGGKKRIKEEVIDALATAVAANLAAY